ncbi:MAG: sulfur carrier protein ThiS [Oscillospiraceae bacterium]
MVIINGEEKNAAGINLSQYLNDNNFDPRMIAVELNYVIIPKTEYETTFLDDGDTVEIVSFMGGGC